jgi:CubicO group peptidase (beta-lactamase class C family)
VKFGVIETLALLAVITLVACAPTVPASERIAPLERVTLESQGLDARYWNAALRDVREKHPLIDGLSVAVGDAFVAEAYFNGYTDDTPHDLRSATKSITSLLVGIAVDRGLLRLEQPITTFFPDYPPHGSWREAITVQHLLTMSSGLDCNDSANTFGNEERMYVSGDWIRFFFSIPRTRPPGQIHAYCTAGVVLLGEIVARAARQPLPEFARTQLFQPLEILEARWENAPRGVTDAGGHLRLTAQSLLKIGMMTRDGGVWRGQRVVSQTWVNQSLEPRNAPVADHPTLRYGFLWWLEPVQNNVARSYQARGNGGQYIVVVPEVKLVVSFTGQAYNSPRAQEPFRVVQDFLIPMARRTPFAVLERR